MKAIIMAGGAGKRLRPLTCTMPKPMVPLLNKPVIEYYVELLVRRGLTDIGVTLHYLPNAIRNHLKDGEKWDAKISYSIEDTPLGTAGSVRKAAGAAKEPVLVISGDAMTDIDLTAAIRTHTQSGAKATLLLKKVPSPTEYGVVLTDKDGIVTRFIEKPAPSEVFSDLANTGIYIFEPEILSMIPDYMPYDFSNDLFPRLLNEGIRIFTTEASGYWSDIGDIEQYAATQADMLDGKCAFETTAKSDGQGIFIEESARIGKRAVITAPCYIGANVEIADNAYFGGYSVACSGVRIGKNSSVKRCILLPEVRVREGAELRGAVLCERVQVEDGASIFEKAAIGAESVLEKHCTVAPRVYIWPNKRLEHDRKYTENLMWEAEAGKQAVRNPEAGYVDFDLTPESAARIGASFAALRTLPAELGVASDGVQQSVMLKYALTAGMVSQGVDVQDMGLCAPSAFAYAVRMLGLDGGIYIRRGETGKYEAELLLLDAMGASLSAGEHRKFRQQYELGAQRPVTASRLGVVQRYTGAERGYEASLRRMARFDGRAGIAMVIAGDTALYDAVARVLLPYGVGVKLITERAQEPLLRAMAHAGAQLGFLAGENGALPSAVFGEHAMNEEECIALLAIAAAEDGRRTLVLPASLPEAYCSAVLARGAHVTRVPDAPARWQHACFEADAYLPELFEPEAMVVRFAALANDGRLEKLIAALPAVRRAEAEVGCTWREVGRVLRSLVETERDERVELIDGVHVNDDDGWVLVRPNKNFTACRVIAGSFKEEYAEELSLIYEQKLRSIIAEGRVEK